MKVSRQCLGYSIFKLFPKCVVLRAGDGPFSLLFLVNVLLLKKITTNYLILLLIIIVVIFPGKVHQEYDTTI